jgi:hypothetical protein
MIDYFLLSSPVFSLVKLSDVLDFNHLFSTGWNSIFSGENSFGSTFRKVADFVNNFIDTSFRTIALTLPVHVRQQ